MNAPESSEVARMLPGLLAALRSESDRGCVLVTAAMIETELESHIRLRLLPPANKEDELISQSFNAPISSFSQKIDLAFRIGLIPPHERSVYHQLRNLRNACAHNIAAQTFSENHFQSRTKNIIKESLPLWEALRSVIGRSITTQPCPDDIDELIELVTWRCAFEFFFALIIAHKRVSASRVTPVSKLYSPNGGQTPAYLER